MLGPLLRRLVAAFADRESAEQRGMRLLKENQSPTQRKQYDESRSFEAIGGDSGRRYRIRHGTSMNIDELDATGRIVSRWCVVPNGELVIGDVLLSQKVGLEVFERDTLAVAHRFSTGSPAIRLGLGLPTG